MPLIRSWFMIVASMWPLVTPHGQVTDHTVATIPVAWPARLAIQIVEAERCSLPQLSCGVAVAGLQ